MQHVFGNHLSRQMVLLGLIEASASFAAIYTVITLADASASLPRFISMVSQDRLRVAAFLTFVSGATSLVIGLYRTEIWVDRKRLLAATGLAAAVAFVALLALAGVFRSGLSTAHALFIGKLLSAWLATMTLIRLTYGFAARCRSPIRRVLLVGDQQQIGAVDARLRARHRGGFEPMPLQIPGLSWPLLREHRIWGIIVAAEPADSAMTTLLDCKLRGMPIYSAAAFQEIYLGRIDLDTLTASDLLLKPGFAAGDLAAASKRISDIILALAILLLALPLMLLTALAIKFDSTGSIFYRQERLGQFDRPFTLFKFRSMTADAEAGGSPRWAQRHDPRTTRVGRFIRASRIDELPQLVNVLRGEMSLVGPRPERPHFVEQLTSAIPFYRQRSYVKPGLTGWAQINFPYGASIEDAREKLAYDLYYVKNRSLWLDAAILLSTVRVVLFREGAR